MYEAGPYTHERPDALQDGASYTDIVGTDKATGEFVVGST
jgi:hypothetical protein